MNLVNKSSKKEGQATLAFILLVGGIIMEIAIAGTFVTYFLSGSRVGERLSARALSAAEAGIRDAQIKIARDKDFVLGTTASYNINIGNDTASIILSKDSLSDQKNYIYTISSTGLAGNRQRKLVSTILVDKITGVISFQSLTEEAVE
jgi:uncharacterized protein (UPF0333 family)